MIKKIIKSRSNCLCINNSNNYPSNENLKASSVCCCFRKTSEVKVTPEKVIHITEYKLINEEGKKRKKKKKDISSKLKHSEFQRI